MKTGEKAIISDSTGSTIETAANGPVHHQQTDQSMDPQLRQFILDACAANDLGKAEHIQSLWSGYGSLDRYPLSDSEHRSIVVKHVRYPDQQHHPRGWNSDRSHQRKLRSYEVETAWYKNWAAQCDQHCRVPACLASQHHENEVLMVLEDLDSSGYPVRLNHLDRDGMDSCLSWLAHFHARFIGVRPQGLWDIGCYWHLNTRPDELAAMDDGPLKQAASQLDQILSDAPYQTLVHGDAKLANFCFSADGSQAAAVDFQYVGGGIGMKDLAYFVGSCLDEDDCERWQEPLLDSYFAALKDALGRQRPDIAAADVEAAWRPLYPVAWTDFHRFLKGWSPGHWKINSYSERLAKQVLSQLQSN